MVSKKKSLLFVWGWDSLVMPNGDPRGRFFYPTLTLIMIKSNELAHIVIMSVRLG